MTLLLLVDGTNVVMRYASAMVSDRRACDRCRDREGLRGVTKAISRAAPTPRGRRT
jgi:hypothetical protein